jgi:NADPH2:quinone reductase
MLAIRIHVPGGPSALEVEDTFTITGTRRIKNTSDGYWGWWCQYLIRKGIYKWMPPLPAIPGMELSGIVDCPGVVEVLPGWELGQESIVELA